MLCLVTDDPYTTNCSDAIVANQLAPRAGSGPTVCAICGPGARMLVAEKAAMICQCSRRIIYRWIEEGALHFTELADRSVLVCGHSLAAKLEESEASTASLLTPHGWHERRQV